MTKISPRRPDGTLFGQNSAPVGFSVDLSEPLVCVFRGASRPCARFARDENVEIFSQCRINTFLFFFSRLSEGASSDSRSLNGEFLRKAIVNCSLTSFVNLWFFKHFELFSNFFENVLKIVKQFSNTFSSNFSTECSKTFSKQIQRDVQRHFQQKNNSKNFSKRFKTLWIVFKQSPNLLNICQTPNLLNLRKLRWIPRSPPSQPGSRVRRGSASPHAAPRRQAHPLLRSSPRPSARRSRSPSAPRLQAPLWKPFAAGPVHL